MRKIRLEVEALRVETFDTTALPRPREGTVRAHAEGDAAATVPETGWESCWGTCENGETCCTPACDTNDSCWDSCDTCPLSCYGSCVHSCESICTRQWTECPTGDRGVCCV